jgi:hypothetical protein
VTYRTELTPRQTWTPGFRGFESRRLLDLVPSTRTVGHAYPAPLHKEPPFKRSRSLLEQRPTPRSQPWDWPPEL